jgi:superfamily II DNA or RNA helicase
MTMPELRDYQMEAVRAVQADWNAGHLNTLIAHATGLGKTCTAVGLLKEEMTKNPGSRAVFVAHRNELLDQPLARFAEWWSESQLFSDVVKAEASGNVRHALALRWRGHDQGLWPHC